MFVMSPSLIMQGQPLDVLIAAVTAFIGVWFATAGVLGYFFRPMGFVMRAVYLAAGLALMIPSQAFPSAVYFEAIGFVIAAIVTFGEYFATRQLKTA